MVRPSNYSSDPDSELKFRKEQELTEDAPSKEVTGKCSCGEPCVWCTLAERKCDNKKHTCSKCLEDSLAHIPKGPIVYR